MIPKPFSRMGLLLRPNGNPNGRRGFELTEKGRKLTMSMQQMDYFDQKPDLDMKAFYEGRAVKLAGEANTSCAPPPVGSVWVAQDDEDEK
jgi:hypothetical protein